MPANVKSYKNLRNFSPAGDLGRRDDAPMINAFPHQIKRYGKEENTHRDLPIKPIKKMIGGPVQHDPGVAPGIGSALPKGRKSQAYKAVVSCDETLIGGTLPF